MTYYAFNKFMENSIFSSILETVDAILVFKKDSRTDKNNYRPIGILTNISKILKRCLYINKSLHINKSLQQVSMWI